MFLWFACFDCSDLKIALLWFLFGLSSGNHYYNKINGRGWIAFHFLVHIMSISASPSSLCICFTGMSIGQYTGNLCLTCKMLCLGFPYIVSMGIFLVFIFWAYSVLGTAWAAFPTARFWLVSLGTYLGLFSEACLEHFQGMFGPISGAWLGPISVAWLGPIS